MQRVSAVVDATPGSCVVSREKLQNRSKISVSFKRPVNDKSTSSLKVLLLLTIWLTWALYLYFLSLWTSNNCPDHLYDCCSTTALPFYTKERPSREARHYQLSHNKHIWMNFRSKLEYYLVSRHRVDIFKVCPQQKKSQIYQTHLQTNKRCWFLSSMKCFPCIIYRLFFLPWLWLCLSCVTMETRCQSLWHHHPYLQLSAWSERRNHRDGRRRELCVSNIQMEVQSAAEPCSRAPRWFKRKDTFSFHVWRFKLATRERWKEREHGKGWCEEWRLRKEGWEETTRGWRAWLGGQKGWKKDQKM